MRKSIYFSPQKTLNLKYSFRHDHNAVDFGVTNKGKERCFVAYLFMYCLDKNMEVTVKTGNGWWDGTDSFLYLELIGDGGKRSGESSVAKGGYYDDFESGK